MIYLIVDTNNWIYLASSKNPDTGNLEDGRHIKLFNTLMEKIDGDEVELLVCEVIEAEWNRNKVSAEELIRKYQNEREACKGVIKKIATSLNEEDQNVLGKLYGKYLANIDEKIIENWAHIKKIEDLIQKATKYNISKETKAFAADWAVEKKAPFIGDKKNSMADAYIFFGAIAQIKEIAQTKLPWDDDEVIYEYPTSIFVSGNKGDFSSAADANTLHGDLQPIADEIKLSFFRSIPAALNFIQEHIAAQPPIFSERELKEIEEEVDNITDDWYTCDVCTPSEENQYTNMVYFSQSYEIEVEGGEFIDPNQLQIEFPDVPIIERQDIKKISIRTGDCSRCGTTHLICEECQTTTPIDGDTRDGFECDGCGIKYIVRHNYDRGGVYNQEIYVDGRDD
jgi:hypothetical protein